MYGSQVNCQHYPFRTLCNCCSLRCPKPILNIRATCVAEPGSRTSGFSTFTEEVSLPNRDVCMAWQSSSNLKVDVIAHARASLGFSVSGLGFRLRVEGLGSPPMFRV